MNIDTLVYLNQIRISQLNLKTVKTIISLLIIDWCIDLKHSFQEEIPVIK